MDYKVKNWENFQHYKDRNPPWIKLHYELLTSRDWVKFDDASKLLALVCMMLASRNQGIIEGDLDYIKSVAHIRGKINLKPLIGSGFLIPLADASTAQADASTAQADAIIEERQRREEKSRVETLDEILISLQKFISENNLDEQKVKLATETCVDWFKSNGKDKKVKDWTATVKNWIRKDKQGMAYYHKPKQRECL
jgi:hypothetical protein